MNESDLVQMYMEQLSTNMEELSFLRDLACHMQLDNSSRGIEPLCESLLSTLKQTASAERVVFLRAAELDDHRLWNMVCNIGDDDHCCDLSKAMVALLTTFPRERARQGLVFNRNGLNPKLEAQIPACIRSCVTVEIVQTDASLGWLLVVNRRKGSFRNLGDGEIGR
ncbi:MAG: hypothetical protein KDA84_21615, partial [Planctomycetaceae bacterium]|nr:hypothetical protein [Planctomycetaceae bacterium]